MSEITIENADQLSPRELVDAIWDDQRRRVAASEAIRAEAHLERFPLLRDEVENAVDVIYGEFVVRVEAGGNLDSGEFIERFPEYRDQLERQFHIHAALNSVAFGPSVGEEKPADSSIARSTNAVVATTIGRQPREPPASTAPTPDRFEVLEELGRGGMGVVYKARQEGLNRLVALKMILAGGHAGEESLRRFHAEAEAVAKLHHPNIVQIHEIGQHEGRPFFALMVAWSYKAEASARERDWEGVVHANRQGAGILEKQITRLPQGGYHPYLHGCAGGKCQNLSQALSQLGRSDEARDAWKRMCFHWREKEAFVPDDAANNHTLARALVTGPFWDPSSASEALKHAETALSLDPTNATFWITMGVIRYRLDDLDGALDAFDDAYELRLGGDALEWYFRAMIHHRQGDAKQAKYWLRRANRWT